MMIIMMIFTIIMMIFMILTFDHYDIFGYIINPNVNHDGFQFIDKL